MTKRIIKVFLCLSIVFYIGFSIYYAIEEKEFSKNAQSEFERAEYFESEIEKQKEMLNESQSREEMAQLKLKELRAELAECQ